MKKLIYFLLLMSLCSVSNNYKITNAKPIEEETVIASEFIEEVTVDGITVERNVLSEENYNWNLTSERQMREEYPNRELADTFELSYDPEVKLSKHIEETGEKGIVPPPWAEPPTYVIEGFNISGNTYAGAKINYSAETGPAYGYYSLNNGNYIAFTSGKYFALPGTYNIMIVDDFDLYTIGVIIIVDNLNTTNPGIGGEYNLGTSVFNNTAYYSVDYSRHYLSITTSRYSRFIAVHDRFIWDTLPYNRRTDVHLVMWPSNKLQIVDQSFTTTNAFYYREEIEYIDSTLNIEFDDYHWISVYTPGSIINEGNDCYIDIPVGSGQTTTSCDAAKRLISLPHDVYCEDPGWGDIVLRQYISYQSDMYMILEPLLHSTTIEDIADLFIVSDYLYAERYVDWTVSLGIGLSLSMPPVSVGISIGAVESDRYSSKGLLWFGLRI